METLDHSASFQKRLLETLSGVPATPETEETILTTVEELANSMRDKNNTSVTAKSDNQSIKSLLEQLRKANPFHDIENPVAWQEQLRTDRALPC